MLASLLALSGVFATRADEIADLLQGTNLTFALAPNGGTLVVSLAGQLWRLPSAGGGAEPLTAPGEEARNVMGEVDAIVAEYARLTPEATAPDTRE